MYVSTIMCIYTHIHPLYHSSHTFPFSQLQGTACLEATGLRLSFHLFTVMDHGTPPATNNTWSTMGDSPGSQVSMTGG